MIKGEVALWAQINKLLNSSSNFSAIGKVMKSVLILLKIATNTALFRKPITIERSSTIKLNEILIGPIIAQILAITVIENNPKMEVITISTDEIRNIFEKPIPKVSEVKRM
jgi:hypothetical protein